MPAGRARPPESGLAGPRALTLALLPSRAARAAGTRNAGLRIARLKEKIGDRANASREVEYHNAWGAPVGEPGRGVRTIVDASHTAQSSNYSSVSSPARPESDATRAALAFAEPSQRPQSENTMAALSFAAAAGLRARPERHRRWQMRLRCLRDVRGAGDARRSRVSLPPPRPPRASPPHPARPPPTRAARSTPPSPHRRPSRRRPSSR